MIPTSKFRLAGLSIILAWGWKRAIIALIAGALSALAMAPFNAWPVLFVTFPVVVWLIDGAAAGKRRGVPAAAMSGFWFGLGYFVPGVYWTGIAFLVDAQTFAWLMPFAVLGLPAYLALFPALGFALARLIWTRDASRVLALAVGLTVSEWLRGYVLSGFPWNAFGYALSEPLALAQTASLIGLWGMTFLSIAIFASPAVLIDGKSAGRRPWAAPAAALALLVAMGILGAVRLSLLPAKMVADVKLRIMQPNLQQDEKFNFSQKQQVMSRYLALSDRASGPRSCSSCFATVRKKTRIASSAPMIMCTRPTLIHPPAARRSCACVLSQPAIAAFALSASVRTSGMISSPKSPRRVRVESRMLAICVIMFGIVTALWRTTETASATAPMPAPIVTRTTISIASGRAIEPERRREKLRDTRSRIR